MEPLGLLVEGLQTVAVVAVAMMVALLYARSLPRGSPPVAPSSPVQHLDPYTPPPAPPAPPARPLPETLPSDRLRPEELEPDYSLEPVHLSLTNVACRGPHAWELRTYRSYSGRLEAIDVCGGCESRRTRLLRWPRPEGLIERPAARREVRGA